MADKNTFLLLSFFMISALFGQKKDIEIISTVSEEGYSFSVKNNTADLKQVTLNITGTGFSKIKFPIIKNVDSNEIVDFCELKTIKGKQPSFKANYTYITVVNKQEKKVPEKIIVAKDIYEQNKSSDRETPIKAKDSLSKGIFVFAKDGCSRCAKTIKHLDENKIQSTIYNISKNKEYNDLM
ncbi:MAG: hypothetical protein NT048_05660 [Flavobacterium sp.]|nr:hypothetical protein [Flavobacterium sp.]